MKRFPICQPESIEFRPNELELNKAKFWHFQPIITNLFQGCALEPTKLEAVRPPAESKVIGRGPRGHARATVAFPKTGSNANWLIGENA